MNIREITIGRSKTSDIYLDDRCIYASNNHGSIYYDGNQMMYRDNSSNGTMVNNIMVRRRAVPIRQGDIIMIAGRYQLNWNQINSFFVQRQPMPVNNAYQSVPDSPVSQALRAAAEPQVDLHKWSWGAFGLYGIWGFFNGCWWAFLVAIFLGSWIPLIPNIIFGIYGTRWAWENKRWDSAEDFVKTQSNWDTAAIIVICLAVFFSLIWVFILIAALS